MCFPTLSRVPQTRPFQASCGVSCTQTSNEAVSSGFICLQRRKAASAKVLIRPIKIEANGDSAFQPAMGRGMTVEGRREAWECSWSDGGRVSMATD
jgi:hypothetical protein